LRSEHALRQDVQNRIRRCQELVQRLEFARNQQSMSFTATSTGRLTPGATATPAGTPAGAPTGAPAAAPLDSPGGSGGGGGNPPPAGAGNLPDPNLILAQAIAQLTHVLTQQQQPRAPVYNPYDPTQPFDRSLQQREGKFAANVGWHYSRIP